jgi:hypothetical protein
MPAWVASRMGLDMAARRVVTKEMKGRYQRGTQAECSAILDELCALTGWHRGHARKAIRLAAAPGQPRPPRKVREPSLKYDEAVIAALRVCWALLDAASGKRLAPALPVLVVARRRHGDLAISDQTAALLCAMSPATIDRRLASDRKKLQLKGRAHTKPGGLLKSQIPMHTWADWDDKRPGFVEVDLVGHEGGDANGEFCWSLTVTDIATGWTEIRSVRNKSAHAVFVALLAIQVALPFPLLGIDSDNGSEFINAHLLAGELEFLNPIWAVLSPLINLFTPQPKLIGKTRVGAKVSKRYDRAQTPYQRLLAHTATDLAVLDDLDARRLADLLQTTNPPPPAARSASCRPPCSNASVARPSADAPRPTAPTSPEQRSRTRLASPSPSGHLQMRQRLNASGHLDVRHQELLMPPMPAPRRAC